MAGWLLERAAEQAALISLRISETDLERIPEQIFVGYSEQVTRL